MNHTYHNQTNSPRNSKRTGKSLYQWHAISYSLHYKFIFILLVPYIEHWHIFSPRHIFFHYFSSVFSFVLPWNWVLIFNIKGFFNRFIIFLFVCLFHIRKSKWGKKNVFRTWENMEEKSSPYRMYMIFFIWYCDKCMHFVFKSRDVIVVWWWMSESLEIVGSFVISKWLQLNNIQ